MFDKKIRKIVVTKFLQFSTDQDGGCYTARRSLQADETLATVQREGT